MVSRPVTGPSARAVARLLMGCGSARGSGCGSGCGCWSRGSAPASGNLAGYVRTSCNSRSTGVKIYGMIEKTVGEREWMWMRWVKQWLLPLFPFGDGFYCSYPHSIVGARIRSNYYGQVPTYLTFDSWKLTRKRRKRVNVTYLQTAFRRRTERLAIGVGHT